MKINKLYVYYWHLTAFKDLPYEHNSEVDPEDFYQIIETCLSKGYNVMIQSITGSQNDYHIMIDRGRFRQS